MARPFDSEEELLKQGQAAMQPSEIVLDQWAGLSHKAIVGPGNLDTGGANLAPTWVGKHARRLNAYRMLAAYRSNVARAFLSSEASALDQKEHREYGDPDAIVDAIRSAVLGDGMEIVVDRAGDAPERPEPPIEPGEGASEDDRAAYAEAVTAHTAALADFERDLGLFTAAQARQEWIDQWSDDEKFPLKVTETEDDAVGLGDGVYLLAWSNEKKRVRLRMFDPGFYFPVLDDDDDFPSRVHLAWQYEDESDGKQYVRRITYQRRRLSLQLDGATERRYPWQTTEDEPSKYVTTMTDARWLYEDIADRKVDDFDPRKAIVSVNADGVPLAEFDLGHDMVPIVHLPNTISMKHHFGKAAITRIAQVFDDIASTDTDLHNASATTGAPVIAIGGVAGPATGKVVTYGPGQVFFTGDGSMSALDMSSGLDALLKHKDSLLSRASTNIGVPEEVLGRVKMADIASGITLLLAFGPFRSLIRDMRLVRTDKYALLFRMVQRLAQVGGALPAGPDQRIELRFGSYMPTDLKGIVDMVIALLGAHGTSRASALRIMSDAGLDLGDDLAEELRRIEHEDFSGAREIAEATASESLAAEYLGVKIPEAAVEETEPEVPGAPVPVPAPAPAPEAQ